MRNRYLLGLILSLLCFITSTTKAQTFSSGNLSVSINFDSTYHDSSYCRSWRQVNFLVSKTSSFSHDYITLIDTNSGTLNGIDSNYFGSTTWTTVFNIFASVSDQELPASLYAHLNFDIYKFISGADTIFINLHPDSLAVSSPCTYSTVSGRIYSDNNGNCVYDAGDTGIWVVPSCADTVFGGIAVTYSLYPDFYNGNYSVNIQQTHMTGYSLFLDSSFSFIFPASSCFPGTYAFHTLPQTNVDFPLQCSGNLDVQCWMGSPGSARPARAFFVQPYVSNLGCDAVSGVLTLVKDHRVAYDASLSAYPADTVIGDTLLWNYYSLSSLSSGVYWNSFMASLHMTPDSSVTIGDTLCFHIYTGVPGADINPANNDQWICIPVVTSYDPNIKEVSPAGDGPTGDIPSLTDELTYTIHFQNTGTAEAIDIHVTDTLDSHVDPTSLKILGTSHLMNPRWKAGNVVDFQFPNIWLADSFHNEPASHGYVRFKVKLNTHTPGTQIKNKGYIYFDTNPAVITNQTLNTLVHTATVPNVAVPEVMVYPNPASDAITVENLQDGLLTIVNMNGAVVLQQTITGNKTEININRLPTGVYVLKTVNKTGITTRKFVKE